MDILSHIFNSMGKTSPQRERRKDEMWRSRSTQVHILVWIPWSSPGSSMPKAWDPVIPPVLGHFYQLISTHTFPILLELELKFSLWKSIASGQKHDTTFIKMTEMTSPKMLCSFHSCGSDWFSTQLLLSPTILWSENSIFAPLNHSEIFQRKPKKKTAIKQNTLENNRGFVK